ncbi:hypothetical protein [Kitasatospora viridis]|uniref:Uncharacterized protein n=1 Tax=Kitasatospora viridis TaxID=281105 RepID=A0A561UL88_9ACTN|nr:hypothetical protein [Kitasatospora viridis]TWG00117.1 hypothetical protein FHX73_113986 [Kitasatospora viridis]
MGAISFVAAILAFLMAMGRWHETHSPVWAGVAGGLALLTLIGVVVKEK